MQIFELQSTTTFLLWFVPKTILFWLATSLQIILTGAVFKSSDRVHRCRATITKFVNHYPLAHNLQTFCLLPILASVNRKEKKKTGNHPTIHLTFKLYKNYLWQKMPETHHNKFCTLKIVFAMVNGESWKVGFKSFNYSINHPINKGVTIKATSKSKSIEEDWAYVQVLMITNGMP